MSWMFYVQLLEMRGNSSFYGVTKKQPKKLAVKQLEAAQLIMKKKSSGGPLQSNVF